MPSETIFGESYAYKVMPDGREWIQRNLAYTGITYRAADRNDLNLPIYGAVYKHDDVMAVTFPNRWRVPSYDEWDALSSACGGNSVSGGALKATGTTLWDAVNVAATDFYEWTCSGAGYDDTRNATYSGFRTYGILWVSNVYEDGTRRQASFTKNSGNFAIETNSAESYQYHMRSVRLVRDVAVGFNGVFPAQSGSWRNASEVHVAKDGVWRKANRIFVPVSGAWREVQ
ncbi:MAG: fibrobacter succinogenes major paralogous domain-containing protein [Flavobacteriales bacterium]|nr:fibrobacter succinogenes major paralogous domain-containing protein [Flavobacteriales bacterium]